MCARTLQSRMSQVVINYTDPTASTPQVMVESHTEKPDCTAYFAGPDLKSVTPSFGRLGRRDSVVAICDRRSAAPGPPG